jgi:hypothetical protein
MKSINDSNDPEALKYLAIAKKLVWQIVDVPDAEAAYHAAMTPPRPPTARRRTGAFPIKRSSAEHYSRRYRSPRRT